MLQCNNLLQLTVTLISLELGAIVTVLQCFRINSRTGLFPNQERRNIFYANIYLKGVTLLQLRKSLGE